MTPQFFIQISVRTRAKSLPAAILEVETRGGQFTSNVRHFSKDVETGTIVVSMLFK